MRKTLFALAIGVAAMPMLAFAQQSPIGKWKTIDDETGKVKSIVEITQASNGTLQGRVIEVLHSDRGPNPTCDKCSGANKGKPVKGMTILWGLKPDGAGKWAGGTVLDPANGKTYKSKLELVDGGNKLEVYGCLGFICKHQTWTRQ